MKKNLILSAILFTIFLDFFNLGLIYPIFTSIVFEGNGEIISPDSSLFYKNLIFGLLIASFPFGQFLGAPIIGQLSDQHGRRKLLIFSLVGTIATLLLCSLGIFFSNLWILLLGRFTGGLMAGNMTLAYASLADFSSPEEKVKNFALIPLVIGLGFALGPYLAGILANPETHSLAGPVLPLLFAVLLAVVNLILVLWKFPETGSFSNNQKPKNAFQKLINSWKSVRNTPLSLCLWILFFMLSSNLLFVQFVGPFAIERFHLNVTEVGYLYMNIGIAVALGHLFLTRRLAAFLSPERALFWSLQFLAGLIFLLLLRHDFISLHIVTFFIMLACAVAYTNAMTLVSNQATKEQQGETMGLAVSIQSFAEFLPATILGMIAFLSQAIPLLVAALCAVGSYFILSALSKKAEKAPSI
jgi:MFS transporter, DHA1 family, tetracycline resistance protein